MGFGMDPKRCEIHFKPQPLLQKTCFFYISETLVAHARVCLRTHALAYICRLLPTYVGQGPLGHFISKNKFLLI